MQRSSLVLVVLLFIAATLVSAVLFTQSFTQRYGALGIIIGQITLATAATVLSRRMRWNHLAVLGLVIGFSTYWICGYINLSPLEVALSLLGVALTSAAWCGALRFFGWQIALNDQPSPTKRAGQFSLATILLLMTIFAVFLGLSRASGTRWSDGLNFQVLCSVLALPACALLTLTSQHRWGWVPGAIVVPLAFLALYAVGSTPFGRIAAFASVGLISELTFVAGVLIVLRVAGIRLVRPVSARFRHHRLGRTAQPLA